MRPTVSLILHSHMCAGIAWHAYVIVWRDQILYATGQYRDQRAAREAALHYVDVLRADIA